MKIESTAVRLKYYCTNIQYKLRVGSISKKQKPEASQAFAGGREAGKYSGEMQRDINPSSQPRQAERSGVHRKAAALHARHCG